MGGINCCVKSCRRRSLDHRGRRIPTGLSFHCFPDWRRDEGAQISELTRRRRAAWVSAVGRNNLTFSSIPTSARVCSRHFHSGKPANELLQSDPDWVPSLHLGPSEENGGRTERPLLTEQAKKQRLTARKRPSLSSKRPPTESKAAAGRKKAGGKRKRGGRGVTGRLKVNRKRGERKGGDQRPIGQTETQCSKDSAEVHAGPDAGPGPGPGLPGVAVRPAWRELKSVLQSVLQTNTSKPSEDTRRPAAVGQNSLSFRDFFRGALEASLEASSRSRALAAKRSSGSGDFSVHLNFNLPPPSSSSSSSCEDCVRLQRTITELQEKLSRFTEPQEEVSPIINEPPLQPDQDLQSPDPVQIEERDSNWMEPLSPQWVSGTGVEDEDEAVESTPSAPVVSRDIRSKRQPPRFNKVWLSMFWFLCYSPALNQMWCHVCRLYSAKTHQNMALIKGSQTFKVDNIRKHANSKNHKRNVEVHSSLLSEDRQLCETPSTSCVH